MSPAFEFATDLNRLHGICGSEAARIESSFGVIGAALKALASRSELEQGEAEVLELVVAAHV
jgi:hypothetical protein